MNIGNVVCATLLNCVLATDIDLPIRRPPQYYDPTKSCYIRGTFYKQCPESVDKWKLMTKSEYKKELLDYIEKQIDKLTVKQIRVLITSYARS